MGFAGSSLHVHGSSQEEVAVGIISLLEDQNFSLESNCSLDQLAKESERLFRRNANTFTFHDWTTPHADRQIRAFVLAPQKNNWISIFEYGEYYDLILAKRLSERTSEKVLGTLWEEHVGAQVIYVFEDGKTTHHFSDEGDESSFSASGELAKFSPGEFVLEDYVHDEMNIPLAYSSDFGNVFLDLDFWKEFFSLEQFRFLEFKKR
jgi:hypothetical protein